ncbi:MAG: translocation/assembly module TamB domain-containing protein [Magnetococcus sp. YQC-9]
MSTPDSPESPTSETHPQAGTKKTRRRALWRHLVTFVAALLLALITGLTGSVLLFIHHPGFQKNILTWIQSLPEIGVLHLAGIDGDFLEEVRLQRLEIHDSAGPWLVVEEARGRPIWRDLARGVIHFEEVRAARVQALRPPQIDRTTSRPVSSTVDLVAGWSLPIPLQIDLPRAQVQALHLGDALLAALPKELRPLLSFLPVEGNVAIDLFALMVEIRTLQAKTPDLTLSGTLKIDLNAEQLQGAFQAELPQAGLTLSRWLQLPMNGAGAVTVGLQGPLTHPATVVNFRSAMMEIQEHRLHDLDTTVTIEPSALNSGLSAPPWPHGVRISMQGSCSALHLSGIRSDKPDPLAPWPTLQPHWALSGTLDEHSRLVVEHLKIDNPPTGEIAGTGIIDPQARAATLDLQARLPELAPFTPLLPWPLQGQADATITVAIEPDARRIDVQGQLKGARLKGVPAEYAPLLGEAPEMEIKGTIRPGERIEAEAFKLHGARIDLTGAGTLAWHDWHLDAQMRVDLPDLGLIAGQSGLQLSGAGTLRGRLQGPWSRLQARFEGESPSLRVAELKFDHLAFKGDLTDPWHAPSGALELSSRQSGGHLQLSGRYRLPGAGKIELTALNFSAPKSRLSGNLQIDGRALKLSGKLKGEIEELSALKPWHGQRLAGRVVLDLDLIDERPGVPSGRLQARVTGLNGIFGRMESLKLAGRFGVTRGKGDNVELDLEIDRWQHDPLRVAGLKAHATGSPTRLAFTGEGKGRLQWPFEFKSRGNLEKEQRDAGWRWEIKELTGRIEKEALRLVKPVTIRPLPRGLEVTPAEIGIGDGLLKGAWRQDGRRVEGGLELAGDLALLHRLHLAPLRGSTRMHIRVTGSEELPTVTAWANVTQGRSLTTSLKDLSSFDMNLSAAVNEGKDLRISWSARNVSTEDAKGELLIPMRIFARHPWWELTPGGQLAGGVRAGISLNELVKKIDPERWERVEGVLDVDLVAGGTVTHPVIRGSAEVKRGHLELAESGTIIHNLELRLSADGDVLSIDKLRATDGDKGLWQAHGRLWLDPERHFPLELDLEMIDTVVMRREELNATANGPLRLRGDLSSWRLGGELTIKRAEFHPGSMTDEAIQVVELEEPQPGNEAHGRHEQASTPSGNGRLDITLLIPAHAFVRGLGLDSEWMGDLHVGGSLAEPRIAGQMQIKRGSLDLLERRMQLTGGILTFDNSWPPLPWIEMEATVKRGELITHVALEGAVRRPRVKLSSEPVLSEEEIISHLLFDRASDSISPAQAVRLALAVKSLQGGGPGLLGRVQRGLGIDRLDVGGNSIESGTVSAGKYLTDDIYLEVEKGLKADSGRVNVEIEMTPQIYLKTGVDAKSNGDVGVQWKKDY